MKYRHVSGRSNFRPVSAAVARILRGVIYQLPGRRARKAAQMHPSLASGLTIAETEATIAALARWFQLKEDGLAAQSKRRGRGVREGDEE